MPGSPLLVFHDTSVLINFFRPDLTAVLGKLFGERVCGDASLDDAGLLRQKFVDAGGHMPYEIRTSTLFRQWVDGDW